MNAVKSFQKILCSALACLLVISSFPIAAKAESSSRRVVRVAFPEQEGMSYIGRSGKITGYNYDYLEKISEYTGWQMEYVAYPSEDGNEAVSAALQDLMDGKVDLLGPLLKNAYEASKAIRALNRPDAATVPIVAISANSSSGGSEKSCAAGINAYISKPVNPNQLKELLHKLLKK